MGRHLTPINLRSILTKGVSVGLLSLISLPVTGQNLTTLGNNTIEKPTLQSTMNYTNCMEYNKSITSSDHDPPMNPIATYGFLCGFNGLKPEFAWKAKVDYWEPSAIIEVSCRNGFSFLMPGLQGRGDKNPQSCQQKGGKWFFEARVWGVDGAKGMTRQQATGSSEINEQMRTCDGTKQYHGYGKKWGMFSGGGGGGPGGSWAAYISDSDKSWAEDVKGASPQVTVKPQNCQQGTESVEDCWGSLQPPSGWVSHPYQPVAAALVAWRAHEKAKGKVSPAIQGGYKMEMDYPFIRTPSPHAQSMGITGVGAGRTKGSDCFIPGDPGPWWYMAGDGKKKQITPDQMIQKIQALKKGDLSADAHMNTGIYIFTVWVKTACTVYSKQFQACKDEQYY